MTEKPALDPEVHEDDTVVSVWKRRLVLGLLVILVVAVAAPTFGGCSGFFATSTTAATFDVAGVEKVVSEEDLSRFVVRFNSAMRMFTGRNGLPDGEETTKEALRLMMLDALAKAEGIHVPDETVQELIQKLPQFQVAGRYDETVYRRELSNWSRNGLTHQYASEMLKTAIRVQEYSSIAGAASQLVPGDAAYDEWKKRNLKLTVEFVASPYAAQRAAIDAMEPTEEQLASIANMPAVRALLAVPPKKTVELAYMKAAALTEDELAAAKKFVVEAELVTEERPLNSDAFVAFHQGREDIFTRDHWSKWKDPDYPKKKGEYDVWRAKWEQEGKAKGEPEQEAPKDPAADYPADEGAQYQLWRDFAEREELSRKITRHFAQRAEREGRTFTDLGPEYARFGLKVVKNAEPMTDDEIVEKFPDPVAKDSEFAHVAKVTFTAPPEGGVFKAQYHTEPLPTVNRADRIADRGFMVMRLDGSDPARQYTVKERPEVAKEFWRKHQVAEAARSVAEKIQAKALAAGPEADKMVAALRAAAAEAGLSAQTLRRFNRTTDAPKVPAAPPGGKLDPAVEAAAKRIVHRNFVQQQYPLLSSFAAGKFAEPVSLDEKTEAAYSMLVVEKYDPPPIEMRDTDVRNARNYLAYQARVKSEEILGFEALSKRLNLKRYEDRARKGEKAEKPVAPEKDE